MGRARRHAATTTTMAPPPRAMYSPVDLLANTDPSSHLRLPHPPPSAPRLQGRVPKRSRGKRDGIANLDSSRLNDAGVDLVAQMLHYTPNKRIVAKDALDHPYFNGLNKATVGTIPLPL